jgi:hypothetical protein
MADNGLTAWDGLREFCGGELPPDIDRVHYDPNLWKPFYDALAIGSWYATGVPAPGAKAIRILDGLWAHGLYVDPNTDIANGLGYEFTDVRFYETKTKPLPSVKRPIAKSDFEALYKQHVENALNVEGRKPTVNEDEVWRNANGVTRERMRELRSETRTPGEKKGGAPQQK